MNNAEEKTVVIYHRVYAREGFQKSAQTIFDLVRNAQEKVPGARRCLVLDIDGHRNAKGGFDSDMVELQQEFVIGVLAPFLSEVRMPLGTALNSKPQRNDVPDKLIISEKS